MKGEYVVTTYNNQVERMVEQKLYFFPDKERENQLVNLYPQMQYQTMKAFGGAITDSAGYIYSLMNEKQKAEMLEQYFGNTAMKYKIVRIPMDSCDFSMEHYEADSDDLDESFEKFSFERVEKYILPLLDDVQQKCGNKLEIMLSPWSPPAYMKTNGERNHGGKLKKEYRKRWANYICRYIQEYRDRGYRVTKMTLQNEPKATQPWDSCVYTAQEQKEFLRDYMWPVLEAHHLTDIEIYLWDHNKERVFEWAETVIDEETDKMIAGMAFHWYSGDHFEALQMLQKKFPEKDLLLSEACIEYSKFDSDDNLTNAQKYAHDIIGNLNGGMTTFIDWNLILDEMGGPNHVGNFCDAPYLFDTKEKQLIKKNILRYIWHFSHFIEPGSVRIGVSRYTDELEVVAFQKEEKIVFVIFNATGKEIPAYIRVKDYCAEITVEPDSISSGVITEG